MLRNVSPLQSNPRCRLHVTHRPLLFCKQARDLVMETRHVALLVAARGTDTAQHGMNGAPFGTRRRLGHLTRGVALTRRLNRQNLIEPEIAAPHPPSRLALAADPEICPAIVPARSLIAAPHDRPRVRNLLFV